MVIVLIITVLYILLAAKPLKSGVYQSCMDKDNTAFLKGICCIVILLHHISQRSGMESLYFPNIIFLIYGAMPVSFYLLFSGYGLIFNLSRSEDYAKGFLTKRLPKILVPFVLAHLIIVPYKFAFGYFQGMGQLIAQLSRGYTPVDFTWYVFAISYFYICFWLVTRFMKKPLPVALSTLAATVLYVFICVRVINFDAWWYRGIMGFSLGALLALGREKMDVSLQKGWFLWLAAVIALWYASVEISWRNVNYALIPTLLSSTAEFMAVLLVILIINKKIHFCSDKRFFRFLGEISYETYLMQDLSLMITRNRNYLYIESDMVFAICSVLLSLFFGWLLHILCKWLFGLIQKKPSPAN